MSPSNKESQIFRDSFMTDKVDMNDEVPMNNIGTNRELI